MRASVTARRQEPLGGNTCTGLLKILALVFMFIDHLGASCYMGNRDVVPMYTMMRIIGRIAFPLYCWCLVVGACRTRSMPRYILRIGLVGLISQPVYMVAMDHPWSVPNIFLTLLLGLMGIWGLQEKKWGSHIWGPILAMLEAIVLNCGASSYGWQGVLLMMLLYASRGSRKTLAATMIAFCLFWGGNGGAVTTSLGVKLPEWMTSFSALTTPFLRMQALALLALPLIIWPDQVRIPIPRFLRRDEARTHLTIPTNLPRLHMPAWLSYSIYPLHLALLIYIQYRMGKEIHWEQLNTLWTKLADILIILRNHIYVQGLDPALMHIL